MPGYATDNLLIVHTHAGPEIFPPPVHVKRQSLIGKFANAEVQYTVATV